MFNFINIFTSRNKKAKASATNIRVALGSAGWMGKDNTQGFISEGYDKCSVVFTCVDRISTNIGKIKYKVKVNGEYAPNHPLEKLLRKPNPLQSGADLFTCFSAWHRITGNSYLQLLRPFDNQPPTELYVVPSSNVEIRTSNNSPIPLQYDVHVGVGKVSIPVDIITGKSNLIHWKTFNPTSIIYGMSPIRAASWAVDQHNSSSEWNQRMLKNGVVPDGVLSTVGNLTDAQYTQIATRLDKQFSGEINAHRPLILEGGLSWQQIAVNPKDMDWVNGKNISAREIAGVYKVPEQLIPIPGSQTFANYEQAVLNFWTDTVIPLVDEIVELLNNRLAYLYGDNVEITYDKDDIPALEPLRQQKWSSVQSSQFLTINEKREAVGYDPLPEDEGGNLIIVSGGVPLKDMLIPVDTSTGLEDE